MFENIALIVNLRGYKTS